jgi:hypothetical protein
MGKEGRFGKPICYTLDHAMKGLVGRVFMYLGVHKGWKNPSQGMWWKSYNQSIVNSEAISVNTKEVIDVANTLVREMQIALKNIARPNAFVEKEQSNIICMKEDFHAKFVAILQIILLMGKASLFQ